MNKEDYDRIRNELYAFSDCSGDFMRLILKVKEIEILKEISESLKSVAASLRGDKI